MALVAKLKQLDQSAKLGGIKTHGPSPRKPLALTGGPAPKLSTSAPQIEGIGNAPLISPSPQGTNNACPAHCQHLIFELLD